MENSGGTHRIGHCERFKNMNLQRAMVLQLPGSPHGCNEDCAVWGIQPPPSA
jgi:hypothetical protein